MPKLTRQKLNASISKLEKELQNLPDALFLDEDDYVLPNQPEKNKKTGNVDKRGFTNDLDADFFDIEMEPGTSMWDNDTQNRSSAHRIEVKGNREFKPQSNPRGKFFRGRARGKYLSMYRGKYVPSFRPQESQVPVPKSQFLYNEDEEDWSRYVSSSITREDKSKQHLDISERCLAVTIDQEKPNERDMFSFPNESQGNNMLPKNKKSQSSLITGLSEKSNDSTNQASEVMHIFQELQAKLSSSDAGLPGFDVLAETLKKLEKLKDNQMDNIESPKSIHENAVISEPRSAVSLKKNSDPDRNIETRSKEISPSRKVTYSDSRKKETPFLHNYSASQKHESTPPNKSEGSLSQKRGRSPRRRDISPSNKHDNSTRKKDNSPSSKRETSPVKRRDSSSPARKKPSSPSRRRHSPPSKLRRSFSRSPEYYRKRDGSPQRNRRDSDWYPGGRGRSPRRRRSRSRSPRRDFRRRSSSHSPHRRHHDHSRKYDRMREHSRSPISLSPSPERRSSSWRTLQSQKDRNDMWSSRSSQHEMYKQPPSEHDPLAQPKPPGGETSDVYAETNYIHSGPNIIPATYPSDTSVPPPYHSYPEYPQYYPPYQPSGTGPTTEGVALPPPMAPNQPVESNSVAPQVQILEGQGDCQLWSRRDNVYPSVPQPVIYADNLIKPPVSIEDAEEAKRKAVEKEMKQQKLTLQKQRKDYLKKQSALQRDFEQLQKQKRELQSEKRADNEPVIKQNNKLQMEVQNKLKAIANVIDMLSGIIGVEEVEEEEKTLTPPPKPPSPLKPQVKEKVITLDSPPRPPEPASANPCQPPNTEERTTPVLPNWWLKPKHCPSPKEKDLPTTPPLEKDQSLSIWEKRVPKTIEVFKAKDEAGPSFEPPALQPKDEDIKPSTSQSVAEDKKFNIIHFDTELHWCRVCNAFPRTAKEFLNHLHATDHKQNLSDRKLVDMPWHNNQVVEDIPTYKDAPSKRVPIKGLQFFISATAWYCKLCDTWIGDLHCASVHLKSSLHTRKYDEFTEKNPHWEVDWMAKRTRAFEQTREERDRLDQKQNQYNQQQTTTHAEQDKTCYPFNPSVKYDNKILKKKPLQRKKSDKSKLVKTASEQLMSALKEGTTDVSTKRKKKSQRSSSSSSSSSSSTSSSSSSDDSKTKKKNGKSIRVAMRKRDSDKPKSEKTVLPVDIPIIKSKWDSPDKELDKSDKNKSNINKADSVSDDKLLNEWMQVTNVLNPEEQMLNQLSDRMKLKQQIDKSIEELKKLQKQKLENEEKLKNRHDDRKDIRKEKDDGRSSKPSRYDRRSDSTNRVDRHGNAVRERGGSSYNVSRHDKNKYNDRRSPEKGNKKGSKSTQSGNKSKSTHTKSKRSNSKSDQDDDYKNENKNVSDDENEGKVAKDSNACKSPKQESTKKGKSFSTKDVFDEPEGSLENDTDKRVKDVLKAGSKKTISINVSKTKLPFIGKMPFMSKFGSVKKSAATTPEEENKLDDNTNEKIDKEVISDNSNTKQDLNTEWADKYDCKDKITKNTAMNTLKPESGTVADASTKIPIPKSTLTLSKTPTIAEKLARAQQKKKSKTNVTKPIQTQEDGVVDMEIDDEDKPEESLPVDFQTTLHLLFPTENPGSQLIEEANPPPVTPVVQNSEFEVLQSNVSETESNSNQWNKPPINDQWPSDQVNQLPVGPSPIDGRYVENVPINPGSIPIPVDCGPRGPTKIVQTGPLDRPVGMDHSQIQTGPLGREPMGPGMMKQERKSRWNDELMRPGPMERGPIGKGQMDHVPMRAGPMERGPIGPRMMERGSMGPGMMEHGPMGPGMMEHGPMGPGMMEHGPMGPGMMEHGPMGPGMMEHGPMGPGIMEHGPLGPGMMEHGPMGQGMIEHGPMGLGMMDRGPIGPGIMECGPMGPGPMERKMGPGPMERGRMGLGPMERGPMGPGPMDHGPMGPGPMDRGPMGPGLMDRGPMDRGPMDRGPMDRGPMDRGPMDRGPMGPGHMGPGPMGPGPMERGPMDCGPLGPGPMERGPMGPGPRDRGPMGPGQMDRGPMGPGQMDRGPMGPGPMDRGPMGPGLMERGPMGPGPMDCGPLGPGPMERGPMGPGPMDFAPRGPRPMDFHHRGQGPAGPRAMGMPRGPPGPPPRFPSRQDIMDDLAFKKKNPPSQKKRQQMKKRREELEAKEKELKEKIAKQLEILGKEDMEAKKKVTDEMAMLGIEEDDLAAQRF